MRQTALFVAFLVIGAQAQDIWSDVTNPTPSVAVSSSVLPSSSSVLVPVAGSSSSILLSSSIVPVSSELQASSVLSSSSDMLSSSVIGLSSSSLTAVSSSSVSVASSSSARSRKELLGPVKVTRVHGIDEMKGRYKSPRKALFLSLGIPGAGQLYVGGGVGNYARGAFYLATEVVLGGLWYHYSVTLYDRQVRKYESYAKAHYSIGRYENGMFSLYSQLADASKRTEFEKQYLSGRNDYCGSIYSDPNAFKCSDKDLRNGTNLRSQFPTDKTLGDYMENNSIENEADLFRTIGDVNYILGWDNLTDEASSSDLVLDENESEWKSLAKSENRETYMDMRKRANDLAGYQAYFLGGIILNHLVSAVDATWAAYVHNKSLYEEKVSWYDRVRFDSQINLVGDLGTQVNARLDF